MKKSIKENMKKKPKKQTNKKEVSLTAAYFTVHNHCDLLVVT